MYKSSQYDTNLITDIQYYVKRMETKSVLIATFQKFFLGKGNLDEL